MLADKSFKATQQFLHPIIGSFTKNKAFVYKNIKNNLNFTLSNVLLTVVDI